jgi:hypothetical protein
MTTRARRGETYRSIITAERCRRERLAADVVKRLID